MMSTDDTPDEFAQELALMNSLPGCFLVKPAHYQGMRDLCRVLLDHGIVRPVFLQSEADRARRWSASYSVLMCRP